MVAALSIDSVFSKEETVDAQHIQGQPAWVLVQPAILKPF